MTNNTPTRKRLFDECAALLNIAGKDEAEFDTLCIFQDMLGDRNPLFRPLEAVPQDKAELILSAVKRRAKGEPLQYILGEWEFYGLRFKVGEGVLIPRPDTETLVDQTLDICRENGMSSPVIADLCSGSGCIAIALRHELPGAEVYAAELSDKALGYLKQNKELNRSGIHIVKADVLDKASLSLFPTADIIVSNPPYLTAKDMSELQTEVAREPETALYGGTDGLDFYRRMTGLWKEKLRPGGWLVYEFGMGQHDDVKNILEATGFTNVCFRRDGGGIIRTAAAVKS